MQIYSLERIIPEDRDEECGICMESWHTTRRHVSRLSCDHYFHTKCIVKWVDVGQEVLASCPYCREVLCVRRLAHHDDAAWIVDYRWDGLHLAYERNAYHTAAIKLLTLTVLRCHEDFRARVRWKSIVKETLRHYRSNHPVAGNSADEYIAVKSIMIVLLGHWRGNDYEKNRLQDALDCLDAHESNAAGCSIEQAFERAGLRGLCQ